MPIVKTTKMYLDRPGKKGYEFIRKAHCDSGGNFSIKLPDEWVDILGETHVYAETLVKVEREFDLARKKVDSAKVTSRKVILYKIECTADIWKGRGKDARPVYSVDNVHFSNGVAIDIGAAVCVEQETSKFDGNKTYKYIITESSIPLRHNRIDSPLSPDGGWRRAENQMPWTKERERFFASVVNHMHELVMQLAEVTGNEKKLLDFIDAGRLLSGPEGAE